MAFQIFGLILSIVFLILLVMKGANAITASLVAALIAGLTNGFGIWQTLSDLYVPGFLSFAGKMFFVFLFGAIYGQVMGSSNSAHRIAYTFLDFFGKERVVLVVALATTILIYGGVSAMVVYFAVVPIAFVLIREANVPKVLLPGMLMWAAGTFAMSAIPGTPQNVNLVPTESLGVAPTAGPILGIVDTVIVFGLGLLYFNRQIRRYREKGIGFDADATINMDSSDVARDDCPSAWKAFLPLILLVGLYLALYNGTFGVQLGSFQAVSSAMFVATVVVLVLNPNKFKENTKAIVQATENWTTPLFNFTCMIAFGAVVEATPGFSAIADVLMNIPGGVYVSAWLTTNVMCGITGSGSGGEVIALNSMQSKWLAAGADPRILARIVAVSAVGFDSLPHCGGTSTSFGLCNEKVGDGYIHAFMSSVLIPFIASIICVALAMMGIC